MTDEDADRPARRYPVDHYESFRNSVYDTVHGNEKRRKTFAAVVDHSEPVFGKQEPLERDIEDVHNNDEYEVLLRHGIVYEVPKISRPGHAYCVKIPAVIAWAVDPWYEPTHPLVRRLVGYLTARIDPAAEDDRSVYQQLGDVDPREAVVWSLIGQLADDEAYRDAFAVTDPDVTLEECTAYKDPDSTAWGRFGFRMRGRLSGDPLRIDDGDEIEEAVRERVRNVMFSFVEYAAENHDSYRLLESTEWDVTPWSGDDYVEFELDTDAVFD
jgi:hypothetical protein